MVRAENLATKSISQKTFDTADKGLVDDGGWPAGLADDRIDPAGGVTHMDSPFAAWKIRWQMIREPSWMLKILKKSFL